MKKLLSAVAIWAALLSPALAANVNIDGLPAASSVAGADLLECEQSGTNRKCTATQTAAYIYGLMSADATASGVGALTLATVNANVGTFGSATSCITTTQNAKGLTTAISAATCTPAIGSITGLGTGVASALAAAMNSSTGPIGALTPTNGNCTVGNGSAWTSAACPGGVTSAVPSTQTGTNYPIVDGDRAKVIYLSNAAAQTPTLPSAATLTSSNGWFVTICNIAAGIQTITPTTSTIGGALSYALPGGSAISPRCVNAVSDGTNYSVVPQGNIYAIASGTAALGTSAITAGTCGSATTVSAPGVVTTDRITPAFNGDPTATTGYLPTAMVTIVPYPTANNVNFKQCNLTASSITPSALTINWQVNR